MTTENSKRTRVCIACKTTIAGKVHVHIPKTSGSGGGANLCTDCGDKVMELYLSKVRRNHQETASFRGFIQFTRDKYKVVSPKASVTYSSLIASLESGSLSVEDLLKVLEQVTRSD